MTKRIAIPEQTIAVLLDSAESEVEELLSEIESWKGNLEGASMEHLPKYDDAIDHNQDLVMTVGSALEAFILEHEYCGELDTGLEGGLRIG
jgi:hypothetical protein